MRKRFVTILAAAAAGLAFIRPPHRIRRPSRCPRRASRRPGLFDVGFRGTSTDGDEARYERFRDLRDGAATFFSMDKNTDQYRFNANFSNAGYRDQLYAAEYSNAKVTVSGLYNGIPMNYFVRRAAHLDRRRPRQVHARSGAPRRGPGTDQRRRRRHRGRRALRAGTRADDVQRHDVGAGQGEPVDLQQLPRARRHVGAEEHHRGVADLPGQPGARHPHRLHEHGPRRRDAVGGVVRVQQREPAAGADRPPQQRAEAQYRVGEPEGHVPRGLLGQLLRQRDPDA